jgi:23S rRNA (guanosine2251-2'-O)-methyltransferase
MFIYGMHACEAAILSSKRKVNSIYVLKGKPLPPWLSAVSKLQLLSYVENREFERLLPTGAVHQGIAVDVEPVEYEDITDLGCAPRDCVLAMLDGVTDPNNLGSVMRSAAAFGVYGLILSERSSCKITGTVAKAASGALEMVHVFLVKNLSHAIEKVQSYGFWVVSFCERAEKLLNDVQLDGKVCLIFGAEGDGIRRLQKEKSDFVVKLPTNPKFPTLNVSTSAAIAFYEAAKQRRS